MSFYTPHCLALELSWILLEVGEVALDFYFFVEVEEAVLEGQSDDQGIWDRLALYIVT